MKKIRIIHLSDFHLESEDLSQNKENLFQSLINDLNDKINENTILILSGDLIDKSGLHFKNKETRYHSFNEVFIDNLIGKFPQLKGRIFFVPGNHDFDRETVDEYYSIPFRDNLLNKPDLVKSYIDETKNENKIIDGLKDYKSFENKYCSEFFNECEYQLSQFDSSYTINIEGLNIGISCFNSSWLCYNDENLGELFLGQSQLESSLQFIKDCDIKIAITHHPLEFYHKKDLESIKPMLYSNYDMLFVGHTHKLESSQIDDLDGNLFVSVGKSISGIKTNNVNFINGYSLLDYHIGKKIEVTYKKYIDSKKVFVKNTDIGNDEGRKDFIIPESCDLETYTTSKSAIDNIIQDRFPKLREDLILSISQSNKSSFSEIFVEPIIGNLPESNLNEQNEIKYYSTSELISSNKNEIIFGAKETGKTILLNKLLIDYTKEHSKIKKIPILIKFNEIGNRSIKQIIREFILKSSEETKLILKHSDIVLLIDDIDFNSEFEYQLKEIKNFIQDNPRSKIIATHTHIDESKIPIDIINDSSKYISNVEYFYLHYFKSKQIKSLISNWVSSSEFDVQQNIEKLLKGFNELGLPKTPLAVTLFLWIINKQQKKPINNSVLVEMFIDNLLDKSDIRNIYFDTFDFDDKQRLLSFLAHYMLKNGEKHFNYRVKEYSLLKEIEEYLKLKIDINPRKVLDYFIDRGVLISCNGGSVRFKAAFFFSYFLAKYMNYDNTFKNEVFNGKNYLNYISEIDFFTGLNREDEDVFNFILKELSDSFEFINPKVRDEYGKIDEVLETSETISSKIDFTKINKPSEEELEEVYDSQISSIKPNKKVAPKDEITSDNDEYNNESPYLSKILKLSSIVLKNSTDIPPSIRKSAYDKIVLSSISFMLLYRDAVLYFYKNNRDEVVKFLPHKMNFGFFMQVLPIIHQVTMYNWLGSLKTAPIIRQKIKEDIDSINISEFEKFLSVYIYSDIRGKNFIDYINTNLKSCKRRYILDSIFIKNLSYYYLRSKTPESDLRHTRLLAEVKVKLNDLSKKKKGSYIQNLKEKKRNYKPE